MIKGKLFGTLSDGRAVHSYEISAGDIKAVVLDRGANLQSLTVFGRDVVGGFDTLEDYVADNSHQGEIIGRVANRVGGARFTMNGREYNVTVNDGANSLHGGVGFGLRMWEVLELTPSSITLTYLSEDGEEGYPAELSTIVTYSVFENGIKIDYRAVPKGDTPISLTNHAYFNLNGFGGTILDHEAEIFADSYTAVAEDLIPTGERPAVKGTPFDFTVRKRIGAGIEAGLDGYDHNMILTPREWQDFDGDTLALAFTVKPLDGETAGIAVYASKDAKDGDYMYITFDAKKDGDVSFYQTFPIDAKDVETNYYVAAVSKDADGKITYGEKVEWSVAKYINAKLLAGAEPEQVNLFEKVLAYGAAANKVLNK